MGEETGKKRGRLQLGPFMLPLFHTLSPFQLRRFACHNSQREPLSVLQTRFDPNHEPTAGRTCCASPRQCAASASATHVDEAGELPAGPSSSRRSPGEKGEAGGRQASRGRLAEGRFPSLGSGGCSQTHTRTHTGALLTPAHAQPPGAAPRRSLIREGGNKTS